jgi:hypothetical protein
MKRSDLRDLTSDQLIERYVGIALDQDRALLLDEISKFNSLYDEREGLERELKGRTGDQRRELLSLFGHPNAQVRLNAAIATLALEPQAARQALQTISDWHEYPQAAHARGMLSALNAGTYRPS